MPESKQIIVSCEHASNSVPGALKHLFEGSEDILETHRGYDPGAFGLAKEISRKLEAPLFHFPVTRLLTDANRAPGNRNVFSKFSRKLDKDARGALIAKYHEPYRGEIIKLANDAVGQGRLIVHLSIHSFTPVLRGQTRKADIGLLYDPSRGPERQFCTDLRAAICEAAPQLVVRMNYPYRGINDALNTTIRNMIPAENYIGMEIEVNQKYVEGSTFSKEVRTPVISALRKILVG